MGERLLYICRILIIESMDQRIPFVAAIIVLSALSGYLYLNPARETVEVKNTVYPVEGVQAFYLYPLRCIDCDLNVPGECDLCASYYDERIMDLLSSQVGVPVKFAISDAVDLAAIFIIDGNRATLADGRNRYNIANTLCEFANIEVSCGILEDELKRSRACLLRHGIEENSIIYHRATKGCAQCQMTDRIIQDMRELTDDYDRPYSIAILDQDIAEDKRTVTECMDVFNNMHYVPQLICPATGRDISGGFTLSQARDFAQECAG